MTHSDSRRHYAVVGNPIAHSRSPFIHEAFARQTGVSLSYDRILAPLDGFAATVREFFDLGGAGLNITVPFKEQAYLLAEDHLSARARLAGAVNTLWMHDGVLHGCNTDGVGLMNDLIRLGHAPAGRRVLLIGAGGAAKGAVLPLLEAGCAALRIVNRTPSRAMDLRTRLISQLPEAAPRVTAGGLDDAAGEWDIVINASSSSLGDDPPALPSGIYAGDALAYDMVYASGETPFMRQAQAQGVRNRADGLGMLVGQAAASFAIWNGVTPQLGPVLEDLRRLLQAA
ncbi:shikimate dehydrogenase [Alcaligenaceae bacterium]|nr:shikimate dehydrogenase [Alcaligenaceae bacterium]